jgi:hypothetical protein
MGLLARLLGRPPAIRKTMEKVYIPMLMEVMDISLPQAQATFLKLLEEARHESSDFGTANLPENYGDFLISRESEEEKVQLMLAPRREEGVRDPDVRWWWNRHDLERRMMMKVDEQRRTTVYLRYRQAGLSKEEAGERVRKSCPSYGDPNSLSDASPEDKPLPPELKLRIDFYISKRKETDPDTFKEQMEGNSTFNALVRKEIRNGNL